jgi:hypothetical protein
MGNLQIICKYLCFYALHYCPSRTLNIHKSFFFAFFISFHCRFAKLYAIFLIPMQCQMCSFVDVRKNEGYDDTKAELLSSQKEIFLASNREL